MAEKTLQAEACAANTTEGMPDLTDTRINGISPFNSPSDDVSQRLAEAYALLTLLEGAHDVCDGISDEAADAFDNIRHEISARALDGIKTLIALAQYHQDCSYVQRRNRRA